MIVVITSFSNYYMLMSQITEIHVRKTYPFSEINQKKNFISHWCPTGTLASLAKDYLHVLLFQLIFIRDQILKLHNFQIFLVWDANDFCSVTPKLLFYWPEDKQLYIEVGHLVPSFSFSDYKYWIMQILFEPVHHPVCPAFSLMR